MNNEQQPFDFSMPEAPQEAPAAPEAVETPEVAPEAAVKAPNFFKSSVGKIVALGVAVLLVVGLIFGAIALFGSNEMTPLKDQLAIMNQKKYKDPYDQTISLLNGFTEGEFKAIAKILKSTDDYQDGEEERKESFEESLDEMIDEYGKNFKYSFKVDDKDKLTDKKDDLKPVEDQIQEYGKEIAEFVKSTKDDEFDWDAYSDKLGITEKQAKEIVKKLDKIADVWKKADVQAGYEMDVVIILKGSELDEPEEEEGTIRVYKVNGKWISTDALMSVYYQFSSVMSA